VLTKEKENHFLYLHLALANYWAFPIDPPVVPKGTGRVRLVFKATNTEAEVEGLANAICEWAQEMLDIKASGKEQTLPTAARHVYTNMSVVGVTNGVTNGVMKNGLTNGAMNGQMNGLMNGATGGVTN